MDKLFSDSMNQFDSSVNSGLAYINNNKYLNAVLITFLILYAGLAAPALPPKVLVMFDNIFVKFVIFFLIAYYAQHDTGVAAIAAIALMVTLYALNKVKFDKFRQAFNLEKMRSVERMTSVGAPDVSFQNHDSVTVDEVALQEMMPLTKTPVPLPVPDGGAPNEGRPVDMSFGLAGCNKTGVDFKTNFYPQYANMKPDVYEARYNGVAVGGYDPNSIYAQINDSRSGQNFK